MDENIFYPELTLETDDIIMELAIKKDYSKIRDSDKRKEEFIKEVKTSMASSNLLLYISSLP